LAIREGGKKGRAKRVQIGHSIEKVINVRRGRGRGKKKPASKLEPYSIQRGGALMGEGMGASAI